MLGSASVSRSRTNKLRHLGAEVSGMGRARLILRHMEKHHLAMQLGALLSALLTGITSLALGVQSIALLLPHLGGTVVLILQALVVVSITFATLFISQVSKKLALSGPERMLCRFGFIIGTWTAILSPLVFLLEKAVKGFLGLMKISTPSTTEYLASAEDISELVAKSTRGGAIEEEEKEMIQGVIEFSETLVKEVMTPRSEIISVPEAATLDQVLEVFAREGVSRLVVAGEELDQVKGILLMKDVVAWMSSKVPERFEISKIMRMPLFVPSSKKVDALLDELRRSAVHFSIVLDEHGGVEGVVTVEDLIEEIVGDIFDEHDEVQIRKTKSGDLLVAGSLLIGDLRARTGYVIPEGEYGTVAGFVINRMGRIPKIGEVMEFSGRKIRVEGVSRNRITLLRFYARQ